MDINKVLELPEYSFIKTEKRLGKNIMLLTFGGSHSYGTNGPTSDIDIRGITAPTKINTKTEVTTIWFLAVTVLSSITMLTQIPLFIA